MWSRYCLGQCAIATPATELQTATSVIEGAAAAIQRASAELAEFVATRPPVEGEPLVFFPLERRRLMAESANTLGLVGAAAVGLEGAEAAALVVKTCEILHPLIVMLEDPGSPYANFMYGTTVQTNAAQVGCTFSHASKFARALLTGLLARRR